MIGATTVFTAIGSELIRCVIDPDTGAVTEQSRLRLPAMIQEGARHPRLPVLYLACTDHERNEHLLVPVTIDDASMVTGTTRALPARAVQLTVDAGGTNILSTHTKSPSISVHALDDAGRIGEVATSPSIDLAEYLHDTQVDPHDRRAVIVARGHTGRTGTPATAGRIHLAAYDNGEITELDSIDLSAEHPDAGFNPRNVAFHPTEPFIYVSLEAQNLVLSLTTDGDRLVSLPDRTQQLLDQPEEARARQLGGVLAVHPSGGTLYAVTRADGPIVDNDRWRTPEHLPVFEGGENTISVFEITDDATLTFIQRVDTEGISARCVAIIADGRILVAANGKPILQSSDGGDGDPSVIPASLMVFGIAASGQLSPLARQPFEVHRETLWWVG